MLYCIDNGDTRFFSTRAQRGTPGKAAFKKRAENGCQRGGYISPPPQNDEYQQWDATADGGPKWKWFMKLRCSAKLRALSQVRGSAGLAGGSTAR